ncbi:MAG: helix-turn-helix domain-containing protein [Pseudomonadota bacterium]
MPLLPWGKRREAVRRAEEMLRECSEQLILGEKVLGKGGKDWVAKRSWDGDPSEMRRIIYYAALTSSGKNVEAAHFPPRFKQDHEAYTRAQFEGLALEEVVRHKIAHFFGKLGEVEMRDVRAAVLAQVERPLIAECVKWAGGNQLKAARVLGLDRNTLRKRMRELKINNER